MLLQFFSKVQLWNIANYRELVDWSHLVERGEAVMRQQREAYEKEKGKDKKRLPGGSRGQSSSKQPPKH